MSEHGSTEACSHRPAPKPSRKVLANTIALAKSRCGPHGVRWTAQRERALELLIGAGGPVKAYDLVPTFKAGASTAPATIYRALETLVELGVAHRIPSLNAFTACYASEESHSASFLICDCCGGVEEVALPTADLLTAIKASGFTASALTIEAAGRCARCKV